MVEICGKTLIFIEESAFFEKGFVPFIEGVFAAPSFTDVSFCVDIGLKQPREKAIANAGANGWLLDGMLDVLENTKKISFVNTNSCFDFNEVFSLVKSDNFAACYLITQKENVYFAIDSEIAVAKAKNAKIVRFAADKIEEWKIQKKVVLDAFFVDKDELINDKIDVHNIEYVYSPKYRYLRLYQDNVKEGGEGKIYRTYQGMMCKIFNTEHISYINFKKLQHMLSIDVFNSYINWPKDIIYYDNNPVGYIMDEVNDAIGLDELRISGFEGISELNRYEIALHLLEHLHYLHKKGIVIGDLKPDNILVKPPNEVFLIDCGSYQVADYPCVVFHPQYTKKKYTESELRKFLRSPEDEYFAINKIIFEIIIGRTPNYDPNNPAIDDESDTFLYPLGIKGITNATKRIDLQRWKLMSHKMREMFYYYFTQNKVSYLPEWIAEIKSRLVSATSVR